MKVICLIIGFGSAIKIRNNPENLLSSTTPEELGDSVSMADMFTYADIVSTGQNISDLKQAVKDKDKPKALEDDEAIAQY